ncbi:hypothetical protein L2E82_22797 [Cichorium intybus]|uniref:Uncharacterized protein n=1 Tax=Cichorium intybus TaxID=13427 RepID=A0ACB9DZS4_CICIN|nr:hypothetical protein L2E82_22797 [Cichorium intybus]
MPVDRNSTEIWKGDAGRWSGGGPWRLQRRSNNRVKCLNGLHPYGPPLNYIVARVHHRSPLSVLTLGPLRVAVYRPPLLPSWSASPPAIALHRLRQSACRFAGKGI